MKKKHTKFLKFTGKRLYTLTFSSEEIILFYILSKGDVRMFQDNKNIDKFVQNLNEIFPDQIESVILYGSAVTEDFQSKKSDLNLLVVLKEQAMTQLNKIRKYYASWNKMKIEDPLFLTKHYIDASLDVFPIEFLNMQKAYYVIKGEDILAPLAFDHKYLRMQCERELKGKLLQLRQGYIQTMGKKKLMKALVSQSVTTVTSIFTALLYLKKCGIPKTKDEIILSACKEFSEIEESFFIKLLDIKKNKIKLSKDEWIALIESYISQIHALSHTVDQLKL